MTETGLTETRFLGRSHVRWQLLVESLQSSPAQLALSITLIYIGWCLIKSLSTAIFATSFGSWSSLLSLVDDFALAGIAKVASQVCIFLGLHFGHLGSNLRDGVLSKFALACSNSLLHLLGFEIVD